MRRSYRVSITSIEQDKEYCDKGWAWIVAIGVALWNFLVAGAVKSFGILYLDWQELYQSNPVITAWIGSLFALINAVVSPLAGYIWDKYLSECGRSFIFCCGFLLSLSIFASGWVSSIVGVILTYAVAGGVFFGAIDTPILSSLSEYFIEQRTLANGIAFSGSSLGGLVMPILIAWTNQVYTIRGTMIILGGIWMNVFVVATTKLPVPKIYGIENLTNNDSYAKKKRKYGDDVFREVQPSSMSIQTSSEPHMRLGYSCDVMQKFKGDTEKQIGSKSESPDAQLCNAIIDYIHFLRTPSLFSLIVTFFFACFAYFTQYFVMIPLAAEVGMTKTKASILIAIANVVEFFSRLLTGYIGDRWPQHKIWFLVVSYAVTSVSGVLVAIYPSETLLFVYAAIFGFFGGVYIPFMIPMMVELVPFNRIGCATGLFSLIMFAGISVGTPVATAVYELTSDYCYSLLVCACMYPVSCACLALHAFGKCRSQKNKLNVPVL